MKKYLHYFKEIILFAIPVILGEIGQILFGIGDILVAGRYSSIVLASLGQACAFMLPAMVLGLGITYAISPLKSRYLGSRRSVEHFFGSSITIAALTGSILATILILVATFIVPLIGYTHEPQMVGLIQKYIYICCFSIIPALIFAALKENLLAYGKTIFPNSLIILFNIFNILTNIFLMFILDLGIAGAAISTLLCRSLMASILYFYAKQQLNVRHQFCKSITKEIVAMGIPIALGNAVTSSVFALVSILIGRMSVLAGATNNILINITSFTYMVPMALASVVAVKVGHAAGAKNIVELKRYAFFTLIIGLSSALSMAAIFALIPFSIMKIFTDMQDVVQYGVVLLFWVAIYQIPDCIQAVISGTLRGLGKTFAPMLIGSFSIWAVGLPFGCYLAYVKNMQAAGLWCGLATGLSLMGILLATYLFRIFCKTDKIFSGIKES